MSTSGISADTNADGLVVNVIPKEGSNTFKVTPRGPVRQRQPRGRQPRSTTLKARGLTTANKTQKLFDESVGIGGPIKKDKLWFFVAPRSWGLARSQAGVYWNKTQNSYLTPPGRRRSRWCRGRRGSIGPLDRMSGRLEWYDSGADALHVPGDARTTRSASPTTSSAAATAVRSARAQSQEYYISSYRFDPNRLIQATWTSTMTSKLLLEAGVGATISQWNMYYNPGVDQRHRQHLRRRPRSGLRRAGALSRPPERPRPLHPARRRCRTSPARTTSRPGSRPTKRTPTPTTRPTATSNYYFFNGTPVSDSRSRPPVSPAGEGEGRPRHLRARTSGRSPTR